MTVTDPLSDSQGFSEEDLLLLTEPGPRRRRDRTEAPPGAETMARPWRLGIVGLGITVGLVARLLAANGYFSINSRTLVYAAAATSLLAGFGLIALAAERDRFDRWMLLLAGGTGLSLGALQWVSPHFAPGTLEWSNATQFALAVLGIGNGVLLAGVLTLAFVRRWPTMTVVGVLAAGVLTLAADSVLLRNEWPAIAALALAFGGVLLAWDQAPRHEPTYPELARSPRISRAALSLAMVALSGSVLQLWLSRGESVRRVLPATLLSAVLILLSFLALIRIRREIQRRETSTNEWTSWMREIRTGDLRNDFETLGTTPAGGLIGDVTGEVPRTLSFPDLRIESPPAATPETPEAPAQVEPEHELAPVASGVPMIDVPGPTAPSISVPEMPPRSEPVQATLFGDEGPALPDPTLTRDAALGSELMWADDLGDDFFGQPVVGDDQPSLFDFQRELGWAEQAGAEPAPALELPVRPEAPAATSSFSNLLGEEAPADDNLAVPVTEAPISPAPPTPETPPPAAPAAPVHAAPAPAAPVLAVPPMPPAAAPVVHEAAPAGVPASGAFSTWLGETDVASPTDAAGSVCTIDDLAAWLAAPPAPDQSRLVVTVETMSLPDFDELPTEVSQAANVAMLERLGALSPAPTHVAAIDGPYLMATWDDVGSGQLVDINRSVLDSMSTPVPTEHGAVGLTGTLALLRPADGATFDALIDQAIQGLVQARQLEALAAQPR